MRKADYFSEKKMDQFLREVNEAITEGKVPPKSKMPELIPRLVCALHVFNHTMNELLAGVPLTQPPTTISRTTLDNAAAFMDHLEWQKEILCQFLKEITNAACDKTIEQPTSQTMRDNILLTQGPVVSYRPFKHGKRYVVLTSKHHEGWTNWRSNVSWNWNSVDNGPHRDLVGDLAKAIRSRTNITFGLYYSLFEWFNPLYLKDQENNFETQDYVDSVMLPQLYDVVNKYAPEYIWSDGEWEAKDTYWKSKEFLSWLYNDSPVKDTVLVNDRWGSGDRCKHGGAYTCADRYNPGVLQNHKWEDAMTVDKMSWGYRRNTVLSDYLTMDELTAQLAGVVSCGGNLLMNIGPTADGRIDPIFQDRLEQMGDWLRVNGEAIYATKPWRVQNDTNTPDVWYTSKADAVYAISLEWPSNGMLKLTAPIPSAETTVTMLGLPDVKLSWKPLSHYTGMVISVPQLTIDELPCQWAWVFKLTDIE